jgi:hypothetical protein
MDSLNAAADSLRIGPLTRGRADALRVRAHSRLEDSRSGWDWVPGLSALDTIIHRGRAARETMGYDDDAA